MTKDTSSGRVRADMPPQLSAALAELRERMLRDSTISGATVIMPDTGPTFISRDDLLREKPERADG